MCSNRDEPRDYRTKSQRERQISCNSTCTRNLKNNTSELIHKTETDSQTQKTNLWLPKGKEGEKGINQEFGINIYILLHKTDKKQGPTVEHRELYSLSCNNT